MSTDFPQTSSLHTTGRKGRKDDRVVAKTIDAAAVLGEKWLEAVHNLFMFHERDKVRVKSHCFLSPISRA